MPKSSEKSTPPDHAQAMLEHTVAGESILAEGNSRIEDIYHARNAHPTRVVGSLHPEVLRAQKEILIYIPTIVIGGLYHIVQAMRYRHQYASSYDISPRHVYSHLLIEASKEREKEKGGDEQVDLL
ncbi:MAG: hypothetical protein WD061_01570 [Candidatus Saccharimonadales bacterium]